MDATVAARPPAIDLAAESPFRVGAASVDPVSRDARFGGQVERLQPQNLKVLIVLARHRGQVVTRDQLVDSCWGGRFIGDDVINRAISTLRQFAERVGGFSIETVPRSGYRLVETSPRGRRSWAGWGLTAAAAAVIVISAATFLGRSEQLSSPPPAPTIALLPFNAASNDPAARELAAAAHDSLAQTLSHTEFPVKLVDAQPRSGKSVADFLISANADVTPEKALVTVRMEDSANRIVVYSKRFESSPNDAVALADQVGGQVAGSLSWTVPELALDRRHPTDPAVVAELFQEIDNYVSDLRALPDYATSRRLAAKAPNSAIVQDILAYNSAFVLPDLPRDQRAEALALGRRAADRVRVLAPESAGSYIEWCLLHNPALLIECEDRLRAGMRLDPNSPWVDSFLASEMKDAGRLREALGLAKHSLARDQYAPGKIAAALRMFEAIGDQDEAERLFRQAQRWWPNRPDIFWDRLYGMADRGDLGAVARFADEFGPANRVTGYGLVGDLPAAVRKRDIVTARKMCPFTPSPRRDFCMIAFAELGDNDDAFAIAAQEYPDRLGRNAADEDRIFLDSPWVPDTDILTGPAAAPMRRDPRYLELARRLGLLAYWRSGRLPDFCDPPHPEPICGQLQKH
jgi:DNA-binding winged helix-turn-helix (wHTH) protein/TolB-like protein